MPVKGVSAKGVAKPFAGYGAKTFLSLVRSLEKEAGVVSPDSDLALCHAVAVKAVLLGFTCLGQLAGTLEADVLDFIPFPATRALLMRMVAKTTKNHTAFKKRKDFVLDAQASSSLTMASFQARPRLHQELMGQPRPQPVLVGQQFQRRLCLPR